VALLDGRVFFTEAELVRWDPFVDVGVLMEALEEKPFKDF
jgi:hypothetical protein